MFDASRYGEILRRMLALRGMSQRALSKAAGVEADVVSRVTTGRTAEPAMHTWRALCAALHCDLEGRPLEAAVGPEPGKKGKPPEHTGVGRMVRLPERGWVPARFNDLILQPAGSAFDMLGEGHEMLTVEVREIGTEKVLVLRAKKQKRGRKPSWQDADA